MRYVGGKSRIAGQIAEIINNFVGGAMLRVPFLWKLCNRKFG